MKNNAVRKNRIKMTSLSDRIFFTAVDAVMFVILLLVLLPMLNVISSSVSNPNAVLQGKVFILPVGFSWAGYKAVLQDSRIITGYLNTILYTGVTSFLGLAVTVLAAYPLSRKDLEGRNIFMMIFTFTMLFSGGTVSWYIVCTSYYHLANSVWSMILPYLMNPWNIIILRTFFQSSVPVSIIESGKLDGAGEWRVLFKLVVPIAVPGIATIALFRTLQYWNDWWLPIMFIVKPELYNLQFLLQRMMQNIQQLNQNSQFIANASEQMMKIPSEAARMALCLIAMGPILVVYPFFQKYFIQGLTIGSLKG